MLETKPIADHAGLLEQLKLLMIEDVSQVEIIHYYQLLILLDVVDSYNASHRDVMEDKLLHHGHGLKA